MPGMPCDTHTHTHKHTRAIAAVCDDDDDDADDSTRVNIVKGWLLANSHGGVPAIWPVLELEGSS